MDGRRRGAAAWMACAAALVAALMGTAVTDGGQPAVAAPGTAASTAPWVPGDVVVPTRTIRDMAFADPTSTGAVPTGFAVGDEGTVLRTTDGGTSWERAASGTTLDLTTVQALGGDSRFVGGPCVGLLLSSLNDQVFPTTDACGVPLATASLRWFSPGPSMLLAGVLLLRDGTAQWTPDRGRTFTSRAALPGTSSTGGSATPTAALLLSATTAVVTMSDGSVHRTVDGGASWTTTATFGRAIAAVGAGTQPGELIAVGAAGLVRTSPDGGATWSTTDAFAVPGGVSLTGLTCRSTPLCVFTTGAADGAPTPVVVRWQPGSPTPVEEVVPTGGGVTVARLSSDTQVAAAGVGGTLASSTDGGRTFAPARRNPSSFTRIVPGPNGAAVAIGGSGLAVTEDRGMTWFARQAPTTAALLGAAVPRPGLVYVIANEQFLFASWAVLMRSTDAGITWQRLDPGFSGSVDAVWAPTPRTVVLVGKRGAWRSTDAGATFRRIGALPRKGPARASHLAGLDDTVVAWGTSRMWISRDAGARWRPVPLPPRRAACQAPKGCQGVASAPIIDAAVASAERLYLANPDGRLFATRNAGRTWTAVLRTAADDLARVTASRGRVLVVGPEWSGSQVSTNGGRTWLPVPEYVGPNGPNGPYDVVTDADGTLYGKGGPTGLLVSRATTRAG